MTSTLFFLKRPFFPLQKQNSFHVLSDVGNQNQEKKSSPLNFFESSTSKTCSVERRAVWWNTQSKSLIVTSKMNDRYCSRSEFDIQGIEIFFFFAWMRSNTAYAIMFVIWCHTTQLEGINFYYVKGQLTRRLDVWSKLIENDWLKKNEQAPAGNQLTIGHFIYHLLYWSKCSLPRMQGQELWKSVAMQGGRTQQDTWDDTWRNCGRVSDYKF